MNRKYITILLCGILTLSACNTLDFDESTGKSKDETYAYFSNLTRLVSNIYSGLPSTLAPIGNSMRDAASDDAVYTWNNNAVYDMYANLWSPVNLIDNTWDKNYTAIRSANSYLENNSLETIARFQWDPSYKDVILPKAEMYVHEVRFLRAFFYFELAKRYGAVPLLTRTYSVEEINDVPKSSFDDVISYIETECDAIIPELPVTQAASVAGGFLGETGRATKGAAMALKAKALLYAASKLNNPTNASAKWDKAAKASWDIIASGTYSLENIATDPLYNNNGGNDVLKSKQLIFERRSGDLNTFEANNFPFGFEGAKGGTTPTQNLADVYEMADGTAFSWENPAHVSAMYYSSTSLPTRDPRFYKNIIPNGAAFMSQTIETFVGGKNGAPIVGATLTGYYLRKYVNQTVSLATGTANKKPHHTYIFRYADVLLSYAEAMNELVGPDAPYSTYTMTARTAVNLVRSAANMPGATASAADFTQYIRDERRRELAFEDSRFWDIRRWQIGEVVKDIYGVKISKTGSVLSYEKVKIQNRVWDNKMYLYPIPQSERYVNAKLTQNPGWE